MHTMEYLLEDSLWYFFPVKHNGILFNHKKKEILSHAVVTEQTWVNLEDIMLSEMSQSQKDKYHVNPHI